MHKIKKIIKWTAIVLLVLVGGLAVIILSRQNIKYDAPFPAIKASADSAVIARGRHLVYGGAHCIDCHSRTNADSLIGLGQEVPLSGGVVFKLPVGNIYSKNLTSDTATGIGKYTDAAIARALRYGVHPDGTVVYDFMPFHNASDEDLTAIISYLRTQKPVHNAVPRHELNALGKIVKALLVQPVGPSEKVPEKVRQDTSAAYGRYLALSIAECNGCHTKRDISGKFTGEPFAGGGEVDGFITPNLTPAPGGRIFHWSKQMFIDRFRMGRLIPASPMPWNSFRRMTDDELTAIFNYLQTLKPVNTMAEVKREQ
jgi:mono/diheme cytochrome c family protein